MIFICINDYKWPLPSHLKVNEGKNKNSMIPYIDSIIEKIVSNKIIVCYRIIEDSFKQSRAKWKTKPLFRCQLILQSRISMIKDEILLCENWAEKRCSLVKYTRNISCKQVKNSKSLKSFTRQEIIKLRKFLDWWMS